MDHLHHEPSDSQYKWWALSITSLGMLMAVLNATTLLVALPTLIRELRLSSFLAIWVMLSYMVVQTVLVLTAGRFSDMYGRKQWFVWGFIVFTAAALLAGLAPNGLILLIVRGVQAIGGALIMGNATAIVADAFPAQRLGLALGINSIIVAVGQVVGPVLGGLLVILYNWHWVFWFNVPIGILGTFLSIRLLKDAPPQKGKQRIDYAGNLSYIAGLVTLLMAITWGGLRGWNRPSVIIGFFVALASLWAFVKIEKTASHPLLNLSLFRNRTFTLANSANLFIAIGRGAIVLLFIFYFQGVRGYNAFQAGIAVIPMAVSMGLIGPLAGWVTDRSGSRGLATSGALFMAVGLSGFIWTLTVSTPYLVIALWLTLAGIGSGLFNSPNTRAIMASVQSGQRGIAAGTRMMLLNTGNVFSMGIVLAIVASVVPPEIVVRIFSGNAGAVSGNSLNTFIGGIRWSFLVMSLMSLVAAALSWMRPASNASALPVLSPKKRMPYQKQA